MADSIDPRFDPAFQRGYDGSVVTGSRADAAARRSAPYVASALQRPVAEAANTERAPRPPAAPPAGPAPLASEADAETPPASAPVVVQVAAPVLRAPWMNPFVVAVTVLGIVVLALGIWLMQETYRVFAADNGFQSQVDYWFQNVSIVGGPLAVAVGVLILSGVLFVCASYWARRPRVVGED